MHVRSSITMTAPEPAIVPAAASASIESWRSRPSGPSIGADAPPGDDRLERAALGDATAAVLDQVAQVWLTAAARSSREFTTCPESDMRRVPCSARCRARRTSRRRGAGSCGTVPSVSTLLSSVGRLERARDGGERRLGRRLAALAVQRRQKRRLLAADVGAGAAVQHDLELVARPVELAADEAPLAGLLQRGVAAPRTRSGTRRGCRCRPLPHASRSP